MDLPATKQKFKHQLTGLYSKLLPTPCLLCGKHSHEECLCPQCLKSLPELPLSCPLCALPNQTGSICGQCLKKPPKRDQSLSLYPYQDPIIRLIADLKYHQQVFLSRFFADQLAQKVLSLNTDLPQLLIPIPLHARRLRERGYNQANELAKDLSKLLAIPMDNTALTRSKDTQPQASLPYSARKNNLLDAFQLKADSLPDHVVLIDDVLTTGHTADTATKTLKRAGVKMVELWTIARTMRHDQSHG